MDSTDLLTGGVSGGFLVWIAQTVWTKVFSTEGKANDALVQQLTERITAQEQRMAALESGLDEERKLRRAAEAEVFNLQLRLARLEPELKRHGIEISK